MNYRFATILAAVAAALAAQPAVATVARWEAVATAGKDTVELDRGRLGQPAEGRASAWSRLVRDGIYIDEYGLRYTTIEAFNRYDCTRGTFVTLKRVWRRDGQLVREEPVARPAELTAEAGSPDARMLAEVCRQPAAAAAARDKPGVMHADMRSAGDAAKARGQQVAAAADAGHGEKKPAAEKPADKASGDKPRFIELPRIDKSQLEDANKGAPAKEAKTPAPAAAAAGQKAPEHKAADARDLAKAAAAAADKGAAPVLNRQDLERQYATSGPRKPVRRAAPKPAPQPVEPVAAAKPAEAPVAEHKHIHWSYEGEGGPENWGKLEAKYATCATGKRQSPIDIRDGLKVDLEPIRFDYKWTQFRIIDNGHTVQVNVGEGSSISVMGRSFQLVQFHFHRPSEERIQGKRYDMVAHLVHKDDDGRLAVIAVLMEKGGDEHGLIQTLWNNMPLEQNQELAPGTAIDLNRILPEVRNYYTYMGSLTTPPCTEDVLWMVIKQPIIVSEQQVAIFSRLYKNNARPVQPAGNRLIKESR